MANLNVTIVIRTSTDGKRSWSVVKSNAGEAAYYIRYCVGSTPKYEKVGATYEEAEAAQLRMHRKLKAASIGAVIPEETPAPGAHRITEVITAYISELRENRRPERSIKSKQSELNEFAAFTTKAYVEELKRSDLIAYKNHLLDSGRADVTVLNKLMTVVTWLKKNPVVSVVGLLKAEDWPEKRDTEPQPYTEAELNAMMNAACPDERLLLRFFLGSGCREQEIAHLEASDLHDTYIQIQPKPQYGWSPKTTAGTRKIPLGDALLADLRNRCSTGLLFPNKTTGRPEGHYLRIIQDIAKRAGVVGAKCHRFRDTFATDQVRARELDLRDIAKIMGHENLEMMKLYAAFVDLQSEQARRAANVSDRFASKPMLVKAG